MPLPYLLPWGPEDIRVATGVFLAPSVGGPTVDFGQDINCLAGLDPRLRLVGGLENLGQALVARLSTPRGGLFYDPNYGTDLRAYVNESTSSAMLARARADVQAECAKDERVATCTASTSFDAAALTLLVRVDVQTGAGPFRLVLAVTATSVEILRQPGLVG
jgi:phage baseplate assembly protein W